MPALPLVFRPLASRLIKRGTVVGDKSAGAVMEARRYSCKLGLDTIVPYRASITDADLIMTDGKSLEPISRPAEMLLWHLPSKLPVERSLWKTQAD